MAGNIAARPMSLIAGMIEEFASKLGTQMIHFVPRDNMPVFFYVDNSKRSDRRD